MHPRPRLLSRDVLAFASCARREPDSHKKHEKAQRDFFSCLFVFFVAICTSEVLAAAPPAFLPPPVPNRPPVSGEIVASSDTTGCHSAPAATANRPSKPARRRQAPPALRRDARSPYRT